MGEHRDIGDRFSEKNGFDMRGWSIKLIWIRKQGCGEIGEMFGMVHTIRSGSSQLGEVK
jgi:hypothetical protein